MESARIDNEPKLFCNSTVSDGQEITALENSPFPTFIPFDVPLIPAIVSIISISDCLRVCLGGLKSRVDVACLEACLEAISMASSMVRILSLI